jgi:hypothetical protein
MTAPQDQPQGPGPTPGPDEGAGMLGGLFRDPATLAATGLLIASAFNVVAGFINVFTDPEGEGVRGRLLSLTDVVEIGDVALLGVAVGLLVLTVDPPGGISRPLLLNVASALASIVAVFGVIRAVVVVSLEGPWPFRIASFIVTIGIAVAAATVAYWAARESFLKEQLHGRH